MTEAHFVYFVLMPVLMAGSIALQSMVRRVDDTKEKTYVVIDRTPGAGRHEYLDVGMAFASAMTLACTVSMSWRYASRTCAAPPLCR